MIRFTYDSNVSETRERLFKKSAQNSILFYQAKDKRVDESFKNHEVNILKNVKYKVANLFNVKKVSPNSERYEECILLKKSLESLTI